MTTNKIEKKKILLALWRRQLEKFHTTKKRIKKVNLLSRGEIYFLEGEFGCKNSPVVKYTFTINKNVWTIIRISKDNGPSGKWKRDILSHLFPKEVGKLSVDEAELLLRFLKLREAFEELISKYGK